MVTFCTNKANKNGFYGSKNNRIGCFKNLASAVQCLPWMMTANMAVDPSCSPPQLSVAVTRSLQVPSPAVLHKRRQAALCVGASVNRPHTATPRPIPVVQPCARSCMRWKPPVAPVQAAEPPPMSTGAQKHRPACAALTHSHQPPQT